MLPSTSPVCASLPCDIFLVDFASRFAHCAGPDRSGTGGGTDRSVAACPRGMGTGIGILPHAHTAIAGSSWASQESSSGNARGRSSES
jgi:hypothetical protein